jgi:nucleotide-binding universal stress UspA family protein
MIVAGCQAQVTLLGIIERAGNTDPLLESLRRIQAGLIDKKVEAELLIKTGNPVVEIRKRTEETPYDVVVIGAVRKKIRGGFWMSSKTYKIIKEIRPPVLSVAGQIIALKRVLICSAGGRYIDAAVSLTGALARCTGASVTLLHVMPEPPAIYASLPRMEQTATALLNSQSELGLNLRREKEALETSGVPAEVRLRRGPVLEEILREIQAGNYDLVVTGSALSGSLRSYVLGDISREIVNRVDRAVLVVRSDEALFAGRGRLRGWFKRKAPLDPEINK